MKAWESKNAKNAAKAGGISLMALSLAACGGSSEVAAPTVLKTVYDAAVTAKAAAEAEAAAATTAKTAAETAQAAAEATATAATAAKTAAEAEAATATAAQTAAETAKTAAEAAQATAEAAQAVAVAAQAAAETAKATADAALATQNTAITNAGFADVDALIAAYTSLITPVTSALTTSVDVLTGTAGNDVFTATTTTDDATDIIIDTSTADADILNYSVTANTVAITATNVETINVTSSVASATALTVDASEFTGVTNLNVTRADLADGAIAGSGAVTVSGVQGSAVANVNAVSGATSMTVTQATTAGTTVNATGVTGAVSVTGAGTINAASSTGTVALTALGVAAQDALDLNINAAAASTVTTAAGFTGAISVNAAAATSVDVDNATGGVTIVAASTPAAATTIAVGNLDASGGTITTGAFSSTITGALNLEGTTGTSDTVTINAAGAVALNTNSDGTNTDQIENLVLGGNGATVTYTINSGDAIESITTTGSSLVNVAIASDDVSSETVTGVNNLELNAAGGSAVDLTNVSATLIDFGADIGQTTTVAGSNEVIKIDVDQTGLELLTNVDGSSITLQAGDDTAGSAQSTIALGALDMNDTKDFGTVNLVAETARFTASTFDVADAALNISGDENVTFTSTVTSGTINASSHTGILTLTLSEATTLTTGSAADQITMNDGGAGLIQTVTTGAGNDVVTVTDTGVGSVITTGAGTDTINFDQTNAVAANGGAGNDNYTIGNVVADVAITDDSGTDTLTFDAAGAVDLSAAASFSFSGIETVDITATNGVITMDDADLSGKTLTLTGDAAADTLKALGGDAAAETIDLSGITVSGTATIQIDGGDKADTMIGAATNATTFIIDDGDVDAGEVITGGTATDVIDATAMAAAFDLSVATITNVETLYAGGQNATLAQGTGLATVAEDAATGLDGETFTLLKSSTSFEAAAEASAAAVDIIGEYFATQDANGDGTLGDNALTYYDEVSSEALTITFTGDAAADVLTASMVAGSLQLVIA